MKYQIGVAGLAVMGRGLALNLAEHGFAVAGYNRSSEPTEIFVEAGKAAGYTVTGCATLEEFCSVLEKPRKILLMVKACAAVDAVLEGLMPYLEPGDIVIDGGNSHYPDTVRRHDACAQKNINFMGLGVSGGEEGARHGPALMPGGDKDAYAQVEKFLTTIAAHVGEDPCCAYIGPGGAGHFVKMTHNGIEYGDMELICEAYYLMRKLLGMSAAERGRAFQLPGGHHRPHPHRAGPGERQCAGGYDRSHRRQQGYRYVDRAGGSGTGRAPAHHCPGGLCPGPVRLVR